MHAGRRLGWWVELRMCRTTIEHERLPGAAQTNYLARVCMTRATHCARLRAPPDCVAKARFAGVSNGMWQSGCWRLDLVLNWLRSTLNRPTG